MMAKKKIRVMTTKKGSRGDDGEEGDQGFDSSTYEWLLEHVIDVRELVREVAAPLQNVELMLQ